MLENEKKNKTTKEIMKKFYNEHLETIECEICYGQYKYFNKSHHKKTKRHIKFLQLKEKSNNNSM